MKQSFICLIGSAVLLGLTGCSPEDLPAPVATQETQVSNEETKYANAKAFGPDLRIHKFLKNNASIGDGAGGWVWSVSITESNMGNMPSTSRIEYGSDIDVIKIYERIARPTPIFPVVYDYRYLQSFYRTGTLDPGGFYFFTGPYGQPPSIYASKQTIAGRRFIEVVAVADGNLDINELDENNNMSPALLLNVGYQ